jgi:hypothetical protein
VSADVATVALPTVVEQFSIELARSGNATAAYRRTHPTEGRSSNAIEVAAHALRNRADVAKRVDDLRMIGAKSILDKAPLMYQDLYEIGYAADPRELSGVRWVNCRRCHGINAQPQWIDANEFAETAAQAAAKNSAAPGSAVPPAFGGFGFKVLGEPNPECLHCGGEGVERRFVADTTRLEGPARKLFLKARPDGSIEIEDRQKARDSLHKLLGLIVDKRITAHVDIDPNAPDPWSGASLSPEQIMERVLRSRRIETVVDAQFVDSAPDTDKPRECDKAGPPVTLPAAAQVPGNIINPAPRPLRHAIPIMVGPPQ